MVFVVLYFSVCSFLSIFPALPAYSYVVKYFVANLTNNCCRFVFCAIKNVRVNNMYGSVWGGALLVFFLRQFSVAPVYVYGLTRFKRTRLFPIRYTQYVFTTRVMHTQPLTRTSSRLKIWVVAGVCTRCFDVPLHRKVHCNRQPLCCNAKHRIAVGVCVCYIP